MPVPHGRCPGHLCLFSHAPLENHSLGSGSYQMGPERSTDMSEMKRSQRTLKYILIERRKILTGHYGSVLYCMKPLFCLNSFHRRCEPIRTHGTSYRNRANHRIPRPPGPRKGSELSHEPFPKGRLGPCRPVCPLRDTPLCRMRPKRKIYL